VSRILPPKDIEGEPVTTSLRLPKGIVHKLDVIAQETNYSRTEVITHFMRWAIQEYEAEKTRSKK
jgi:metal-responsive CopG/Arc/MetJ family transcriptional regulator